MTFTKKITLLFLCSINFIYAQKLNFLPKQSKIDKLVSTIDQNLEKYEKVTLDDQAAIPMKDEKWELTGYYKKNKIQKIQFRIEGSYGIININFYFNNTKLFFALETHDSFLYEKDKLSSDYPPTDTTFHGYYYFKKNFLIYYVSTGHNRFEDDTLDPDKILIEEVTKYLNLLQKKRKNQ